MGSFLPRRISNLQGWIPETDVDGLDFRGRDSHVANCLDIVFENGFIRNQKDTIFSELKFADREKIIDVAVWNHSKKGRVWVYVIWNVDDEDLYIRVATNTSFDIVLFENPHKFQTEPTSIVFTEFGDELKINTNVKLDIQTDVDVTVYGNFSLQYLDEAIYDARWSPFTQIVYDTNPEGWYLVPRWLTQMPSMNVEVTEDYSVNLEELAGNYDVIDNAGSSLVGLQNVTLSSGSLIFDLSVANRVTVDGDKGYIKEVNIELGGVLTVGDVYTGSLTYGGRTLESTVIVEAAITTKLSFYLNSFGDIFEFSLVSDNDTSVAVDEFLIDTGSGIDGEGYVNYIILARNFDGQRGVLFTTAEDINPPVNPAHSLFNSPRIQLTKNFLDFRMIDLDDLELYMEDPNSGIYYLVETTTIALTANDFSTEPIFQFAIQRDSITNTSLNFNYGLGASVLPYKTIDDITGDIIIDEIFYKNKSYYVKEDNNLYFSFISGNAKLQSDSFPYNEDVQFGFIYEPNTDSRYKALAVTNMDEIVLVSEEETVVYVIQSSGSTIYRKIKTINGSYGIGNRAGLMKDLIGRPSAQVLAWTDYKGVYLYGGGISVPKDVTINKIKNYWRIISYNMPDSVIAYYPSRNEVIIAKYHMGFVLSLDTLEWRRISFKGVVKSFVGIVDDMAVFLLDSFDGATSYLERIYEETNEYKSGSLDTHYNTDYAVDDRGNITNLTDTTSKIVQQFFVSFKKILEDTGVRIKGIAFQIIADGYLIEPGVFFSSMSEIEETMAYLLLKYKKLKIRLTLSNTDIEIREFGYKFNVKETSIELPNGKSEGGFGNAYGIDFGNQL